MDRLPELSARQCRFVDAYIDCGNASEAARRAGYRPNSARQIATENLSKPAIRGAIAARKREIAAALMLTRDQAVTGLLEAVSLAKQMGNPGAMISGLREVGRMLGFYETQTTQQEWCEGLEGSRDLRRVPTHDLLRAATKDGDFRNANGSLMRIDELDALFQGLSEVELRALADGRARIETRVVVEQ